MASSFDTTLPPEIRVLIYPILLTSPHRLTRATSPALRKELVDTSILETCSLMYKEAIEVLYDENQFAVPLREMCQICEPMLAMQPRCLQAAVKPLKIIIEDCQSCCLASLDGLLFHATEAPTGGVDVRLRDGSFSWEQLSTFFDGLGDVHFGDVGDFKVVLALQGTVTFKCSTILGAWDYVAEIPPVELSGMRDCDLSKGKQDMESRMAECACVLLKIIYGKNATVWGIPLGAVMRWKYRVPVHIPTAGWAMQEMVNHLHELHKQRMG